MAATKHVFRVGIVGAGPAGFYTAHQLYKILGSAVHVDLYEKLPVPYGLVRYGVAPDHPEVKNVTDTFLKVAQHPNTQFVGNVAVGKDIELADLSRHYHAMVLSYGAQGARKLGIPGEELASDTGLQVSEHRNVLHARSFVEWYNGLPQQQDLQLNLLGSKAIVIGNGNVALDIARILLSPLDLLKKTDITKRALDALAASNITHVEIIGRRGPLEAAFTIKELREITRLPNTKTIFPREHFTFTQEEQSYIAGQRPRKRLVELMQSCAVSEEEGQLLSKTHGPNQKLCSFRFNVSPSKFNFGDEGLISGLDARIGAMQGPPATPSRRLVLGSGSCSLEASLIFKSVGYMGLPLDPKIPFDSQAGVIPNKNGRVGRGLYCSGWVRTGPLGIIATTMAGAFTTAETLVADFRAGDVDVSSEKKGLKGILPLLKNQVVHTPGFLRILEHEAAEGQRVGKVAEKVGNVNRMLEIARS